MLSFDRRRYNSNIKRAVLLMFLLGIFFATIFFIINLLTSQHLFESGFISKSDKEMLEELWKNKNYESIVTKSNQYFDEHPMAYDYLLYGGISNFYIAEAQFSFEDKLEYLDSAITYLRKALIIAQESDLAKIYYTLAKTYYHKGFYYYDLVIYYMHKSIELDYINLDSYEHLALVYNELQMYEKALDAFYHSLHINQDKILLKLGLAVTYKLLENYEQSEIYLKQVLETDASNYIREQAYFHLGDIHFINNEYNKAIAVYELILELNEDSDDAYLYLGNIYEALSDIGQARWYWRQALQINKNNYLAAAKLN